MRNTVVKVTWYKPSGKWYCDDFVTIPNTFDPAIDSMQDLIIEKQNALTQGWNNGSWFVTVSTEDQSNLDGRFFERLYKFNID